MTTLRIAEIFGPTTQSEGALIGKPTVIVGADGCDCRCRWSDRLHAVESRFRQDCAAMATPEIFGKLRQRSGRQPLTVSLSGDNPAIQDFGPLIDMGSRFACRTQGGITQDWFGKLSSRSCRQSRPHPERLLIGRF